MAGKHQNIIQGHSNPSRPCSETIRDEVQDATTSGLPEEYVEYQGPRLTRERAKHGGGDGGVQPCFEETHDDVFMAQLALATGLWMSFSSSSLCFSCPYAWRKHSLGMMK